MKANKITVTIVIEVLSTDCVPSVAQRALENYSNEMHNGKLVADDGDTVTWKTESKEVNI